MILQIIVYVLFPRGRLPLKVVLCRKNRRKLVILNWPFWAEFLAYNCTSLDFQFSAWFSRKTTYRIEPWFGWFIGDCTENEKRFTPQVNFDETVICIVFTDKNLYAKNFICIHKLMTHQIWSRFEEHWSSLTLSNSTSSRS